MSSQSRQISLFSCLFAYAYKDNRSWSGRQVPIAELIEYLRNTDRLFKAVNQTLNEKYAIGYNTISIEVVMTQDQRWKAKRSGDGSLIRFAVRDKSH